MPQTQSGQIYPFDAGPGVGYQDILTMVPYSMGDVNTVLPSTGEPMSDYMDAKTGDVTPKVNYLWYLLAIFLLLVLLKYASEHEKTDMQPAIAGIGVYNFVVIGIMAMLFSIVGKVIFNKYPVKGVTQLFNMA